MTSSAANHESAPFDFQASLQSAGVGVLALNAQRQITYINDALKQLVGGGNDLLGRDIVSVMSAANAPKVQNEFELHRSGTSTHYELEIETGDGGHRTLNVAATPQLTPEGEFGGAVAIVTDITEKADLKGKLEAYTDKLKDIVGARTDALIASEQRYKALFEDVSDGILRVDPRGQILLCNDAFAAMLHAEAADLLGKRMTDLMHEDDRPVVLENERRRRSGLAVPTTQIFQFEKLDGSGTIYLESSSVTTVHEEAVDTIQIIARDVTERVLAEKELKRAYAELKGLSQAKTNFLANVTHELKTPLVTIRGYAQMLHGESLGPISDGQRHALETSMKNIDVLVANIERLLSITRLELDDEGLIPESVPIMELLTHCQTDCAPLADEKGVIVEVADLDDDLPPIAADSVKLTEAMHHLVVNGIKFTEREGHVFLSAERDGERHVKLTVRDTGIGMEPERIEKLFEPFEQGDGAYTRDYEGLGIGLALVRRIIEAHGGRMGVESTPGEGSTLWCVLPASDEEPSTMTRSRGGGTSQMVMWDVNADHHEDADLPIDDEDDEGIDDFDLDEDYGNSVVFVDHDHDMLRLLQTAFEEADFPLQTIANADSAVSEIRDSGARVVFLDMAMPERDGVDVLRDLRSDPETATIPIYIFTGNNGVEMRAAAKAAGATGFITKPVSLDYLLKVVERHPLRT